MFNKFASLERLNQVRDCLREAMGDHMVASTIFAKQFPAIYRAIANGADPVNVARAQWHIDFAGGDDYQSL